jgi:hypothetical protein
MCDTLVLEQVEKYLATKWKVAGVGSQCPRPSCQNMSAARIAASAKLERFVDMLGSNATLKHTYAFLQASLALDVVASWRQRCRMMAAGELKSMTTKAALASVDAVLVGFDNINTGLAGIIGEMSVGGGAGCVASLVRAAWAQAGGG